MDELLQPNSASRLPQLPSRNAHPSCNDSRSTHSRWSGILTAFTYRTSFCVPHDGTFSRHQKLATDWDRVVDEIRQQEGFGSFLRITPFRTLQKAVTGGPVILVNISQYRSDAIIVQAVGPPLLVSLPQATPAAVKALVLTLQQAVCRHIGLDESNRLLEGVCRDIWRITSEPIVNLLEDTLKLPTGSHIWWVATSNASSLPIHASGPYRPRQVNLPDKFISSYAPTLSSLNRARAGYLSVISTSGLRLLVVAQAGAEGESELPYVSGEIAVICERVMNTTVLEGEECTRKAVLSQFRDADWVHFACHGHQHPTKPFDSHFSLRTRNAPLTLLDIISTDHSNAELAVLAACHSAAGDKSTPDEIIHMVAGMLFAGFRTVVGTMWAMADEGGPIVAEAFYRYMLRNGPEGVDCRDAGKALVMGVRDLRRRNVPMERWINFVHFGI